MIKMFEKYKSLSESGIRLGDKVVIIYKNCKQYMQCGKIISITVNGPEKGDVKVLMEYDKIIVTFFYTNLLRVEEFVEVPTGEVFNIPYDSAIELAIAGIGRWNDKSGFYYFKEEDKWQVESYMI